MSSAFSIPPAAVTELLSIWHEECERAPARYIAPTKSLCLDEAALIRTDGAIPMTTQPHPIPCPSCKTPSACKVHEECIEKAEGEASSLPVVVSSAPERIYLVIGKDCPLDARWDQLAEVTWCEDNIDGNGVVYVRDDIARLRTADTPLYAVAPAAAAVEPSDSQEALRAALSDAHCVITEQHHG